MYICLGNFKEGQFSAILLEKPFLLDCFVLLLKPHIQQIHWQYRSDFSLQGFSFFSDSLSLALYYTDQSVSLSFCLSISVSSTFPGFSIK